MILTGYDVPAKTAPCPARLSAGIIFYTPSHHTSGKEAATVIVPRLYEDLSVLHQNTMPVHSYFIPASAPPRALPALPPREESDRLQMLSGCAWNFRYFSSIHELHEKFYLPDFTPDSKWKEEEVPFCWQMKGYDEHQYTNIRYPFPFDPPYVPQANPCGAYLHTFTWHRNPDAPCSLLHFEGVDSCFYVWLNGSPIRFRGVNRHESDPVTGPVQSRARIEQDLQMIKKYNFNAVRASHYPNVPYFYQLCDELGFYVCDEADNESHGTAPLSYSEDDYSERMRMAHVRIADNPDFILPTLDRVRSMVLVNRNRPSVLVWSMGKEYRVDSDSFHFVFFMKPETI